MTQQTSKPAKTSPAETAPPATPDMAGLQEQFNQLQTQMRQEREELKQREQLLVSLVATEREKVATLEKQALAEILPAKPTPSTYSTQRERLQHSESVLMDPLYVGHHPSTDRFASWARSDQEHYLSSLGYQSVDPADVELMEGGTWEPKEKDFGLRLRLSKGDSTVQIGEHRLMWCYKRERAERLERERIASLRIKPKANDSAESAEEIERLDALKNEFEPS